MTIVDKGDQPGQAMPVSAVEVAPEPGPGSAQGDAAGRQARVAVAVVAGSMRYGFTLDAGDQVSIGADSSCTVLLPVAAGLPVLQARFDGQRLSVEGAGRSMCVGIGEQATMDGPGGPVVQVSAGPVGEREVIDVQGVGEVTIGQHPGCSLQITHTGLEIAARRRQGGWLLAVMSEGLFVNNHACPVGEVLVRDGDHLGAGPYELVLGEREIWADGPLVTGARLPRLTAGTSRFGAGYPDYRRSPRLILRPPEDKFTINAAPAAPEKSAGQLAKLIVPPSAMLVVTVAMALMRGNAIMVLATGATTVVTMVFSVLNYVKDRKKAAANQALVDSTYEEYLAGKAREIHGALSRQRDGGAYHYPDVPALATMATRGSSRVYEKTRLQFDFLCYRLGLGQVPASFEVEYADKEHEKKGTELAEAAFHLYDSARQLDGMPVVTDLMHGPAGYVGPRRLVIEQLQLLVCQLAFFHSYHDLQFVLVFPEAEKPDWEWARWLRHASLQDVNVRGMVYDQRSRDQVLSSVNQILKARLNAASEQGGKQEPVFTPHFVMIVLDESLILDHQIMEFLQEDPTPLGCSVIFVQDTMSALADQVKTVVDIRDRATGVLVIEQGEVKDTAFTLDHFPAGWDFERLPRALGALNHLLNLKSSIPDAVTFLELYGAERFEDLDVLSRWGQHSPHKTLAVPLGLRGPDDIVNLDLHEKAHGPHGLVAGTTGSGKSEIIQSYIISLAVNFHPHDVAFLLIDYKGGGMANLFSQLPHLLGSITNLDGAQAMRALVSINAELKRRQRVFGEHNVNHINQYQKLYKQGDAAEPMPHLFLISDEFAELKAEQPEFMDELVSTARIGRSLGIHLILATQKPSGVVNDQIWSNSKFKLALKVADKADSMEIIKTPDAAEITLPGRAYLQVGNNEIYELFQSAWSGADYQPDKTDANVVDHTIYAINALGQYEILNEDLSGLEEASEVKQIPTELEAIVTGIRDLVAEQQIPALPRPWLPPLPARVFLPELHGVDVAGEWGKEKSPLAPVIGLVDVPSMQAQRTLALDLSGDGHLAVYGSPGYGKSTFLQALAMDLVRTHSPAHLHFYLLDFGTNGLLPLRGLPHVADTIGIEDQEKAGKFISLIEAEIKARKQLLSQYAVANLGMFEKAAGTQLPEIVILLDSYEGFKDAPFDDALTSVLHLVAREGAGLGIHLIVTAGRQSAMRVTLSGNIKTQIALKLNDDAEARSIVGRTTLTIDDLPGRGMIKLDQPEIFQTALPAAGQDMLEVIEAIRAEAKNLRGMWQGPLPAPIPVIPETLTFQDFASRPRTSELVAAGVLPFGLDYDQVQPCGIDLARARIALLLGKDGEAAANLLTLAAQVAGPSQTGNWYVVDDVQANLRVLRTDVSSYAGDTEAAAEVIRELTGLLTGRKAGFQAAQAAADPPALRDYAATLEPVVAAISDPGVLADKLSLDAGNQLATLGAEGPSYGIYFLCAIPMATAGKGYDEFSTVLKTATTGIVAGKAGDQSVLQAANIGYREPEIGPGEGYLIRDSIATRIKMPTT